MPVARCVWTVPGGSPVDRASPVSTKPGNSSSAATRRTQHSLSDRIPVDHAVRSSMRRPSPPVPIAMWIPARWIRVPTWWRCGPCVMDHCRMRENLAVCWQLCLAAVGRYGFSPHLLGTTPPTARPAVVLYKPVGVDIRSRKCLLASTEAAAYEGRTRVELRPLLSKPYVAALSTYTAFLRMQEAHRTIIPWTTLSERNRCQSELACLGESRGRGSRTRRDDRGNAVLAFVMRGPSCIQGSPRSI